MSLHLYPPLTPRRALLSRPGIIGGIVSLSVAIALLASINGSDALLLVDEPIQRWLIDHRGDRWTTVALWFSRLGSNPVVFVVSGVLVLWAWRRCGTLAFTLAVAVISRPPLEFLLKELVDRDRPNLSPLVDGTGPSHPSGHVLAAVALWGLLPPLVSTFIRSKALWWATASVAGVLIVGISASRVYLGVHWFTDIVQGMLLGSLYLAALECLLVHNHRLRQCAVLGEPAESRAGYSRPSSRSGRITAT
ncbi:MAG: phosphatase PAP2 family protein [Acidimicrobiales bacterium]